MIDNYDISNIENNFFIKDMCDYCKKYDLYYAIYDFVNLSNSSKNGIYFVMGLNRDKVLNDNIDILDIFKRSSINKEYFYTDVACIRLDNSSPYYVAKSVLDYCGAVGYIKKEFEKKQFKVPDKILKTEMVNYYMTEYNLKNRSQIDSWLYELLKYSKDASIENINKGFNLFNKKEHTSNEVPLEDIIKTSTSLTSRKILVKYLEPIRKALNKIPNINFNISDVEEIKFDIKNGLFAPEYENNDLSYFKLTFDSAFNELVSTEMFKIVYPNISDKHLENTDNLSGVKHFGIDEDSVCDFIKNCERNGIEIKISKDNLFFNNIGTVVHLVCNEEDIEKVEKIGREMLKQYARAKDIKEIHIYNNENLKGSYNLLTRIGNNEKEI